MADLTELTQQDKEAIMTTFNWDEDELIEEFEDLSFEIFADIYVLAEFLHAEEDNREELEMTVKQLLYQLNNTTLAELDEGDSSATILEQLLKKDGSVPLSGGRWAHCYG